MKQLLITENTDGKKLNEIDFDYRICEILADLLGLKHEEVYTLTSMQTIFQNYYSDKHKFRYLEIFKQITNLKKENYNNENRSYLTGCIYHQIRDSDAPFDELPMFSYIFPKESLCALYLYLLFN